MIRKAVPEEKLMGKILRYCALQERATSEVRKKLYEWGAGKKSSEEIIKQLIEENFLNEKRFAMAYVRGKHRSNKWGKLMIRYGMQQKQIAAVLIDEALNSLESQEYLATLRQIISKKEATLGQNIPRREKNAKLIRYAASKGYEMNIIIELLNESAEDE